METTGRSQHSIRFAAFELDLRTRELYGHGQKLKLQGHPIDVLAILLERPGELVTREALQTKLWPNHTFVDFEHGLNSTINRLRETLGDHAESPRYIETLPRLGYRFITPVEPAETQPLALVSEPAQFQESDPPAQVAKPPTPPRRSQGLSSPLALLGVVALLLVLNPFGFLDRLFQRAPPTPAVHSIAVLPLQCLSHDPAQEYFADGMTDALLTRLGSIGTLRVISRQTIMRYKDSTRPLSQIAQELNVDAVMEGTVLRSGDKVRITAQLLEGKTDRSIWSGTYEGDFRDVLNLQSEVAESIAREINVTLSPAEAQRLKKAASVNPGAYEDYLKGRFELNKLSRQGLDDAEQYFQRALLKDHNYALAYAGLADVWMRRADAGYASPAEAQPMAFAADNTALEFDKDLAEAHVSLGSLNALSRRDWAAAEREYRTAIELSPNSAEAHCLYADLLITLRRNQEWHHEIQHALVLDPLSNFVRTFYGWHLIYLGRYDEAIAVLNQVLASQPGLASAHRGLWGAYDKKHMQPQALQQAADYFRASSDQQTASILESAFHRAGYTAAMRQAAESLARRAQQAYVPNVRIARLYAHAGDPGHALLWLRKAVDEGEPPMMHLSVSWDWDPLRSDPRFHALLGRMNYPQ